MSSDTFDFVNRANAEYIDRLYQQYLKDPRSLEDHWKAFFAGFDLGLDRTAAGQPAPACAGGAGDWGAAPGAGQPASTATNRYGKRVMWRLFATTSRRGQRRAPAGVTQPSGRSEHLR